MKRISILTVVATGWLSSAAYGADFPNGGYDWSGVYVGASIGYGGGSTDNSWRNSTMSNWEADGEIKYRSLLGGGYIGLQQQFGNVVVGAEADYTWMRFRGDDSQFAGVINGLEVDGVGTARARLGWATDKSLFYVTGGIAYGEITKSDMSLLNTKTSAKTIGWAAGAGAEHAFSENWIGRLGYQYVDLGKAETLLQDNLGGSYSHRVDDLTFHSLQVGIGYKF